MNMDTEIRDEVNQVFPGLIYEITSPEDVKYNCIAWAAGFNNRIWWPDLSDTVYWPENIERRNTLANFIAAFGLLGYTVCDSIDIDYEDGYEKIAIFICPDKKTPKHAARQLISGAWASKLGFGQFSVDIEHTIESLNGGYYGIIGAVMKRLRVQTEK
jgi:hypothetical protein